MSTEVKALRNGSKSVDDYERRARCNHPGTSDRRDLPWVRRNWTGHRVAILWRAHRGNERRRTQTSWTFGRLLADDPARPECLRVEEKGGRIVLVHYRRVLGVYDLSRTLPEVGFPPVGGFAKYALPASLTGEDRATVTRNLARLALAEPERWGKAVAALAEGKPGTVESLLAYRMPR